MDFYEALKSRRSIRVFTPDKVPDEVVDRALDAALLAPNSSNMQTWEFFWIKDEEKKKQLIKICLNQTAARTAQHLIVATCDPRVWPEHAKEIHDKLKKAGAAKGALDYYGKLMPFIYGMQYLAPLKWLIFNLRGLFKPTPRNPWSYRDREEVCIKSSALACQNLMLAIRAEGFDSCPMEGFDEARLAKLLGLSWSARIVMVIAVGQRAPAGVWGPQFRFERSRFIHTL
jgi:nitroreductase